MMTRGKGAARNALGKASRRSVRTGEGGGRDTQLKIFPTCTAHEPMRESTKRLLLRHGSIRNGIAYVTFTLEHPLPPALRSFFGTFVLWEEKKGWEWRCRENLLETWLMLSLPVYHSRHHTTPPRQCLLLPRSRKAYLTCQSGGWV